MQPREEHCSFCRVPWAAKTCWVFSLWSPPTSGLACCPQLRAHCRHSRGLPLGSCKRRSLEQLEDCWVTDTVLMMSIYLPKNIHISRFFGVKPFIKLKIPHWEPSRDVPCADHHPIDRKRRTNTDQYSECCDPVFLRLMVDQNFKNSTGYQIQTSHLCWLCS